MIFPMKMIWMKIKKEPIKIIRNQEGKRWHLKGYKKLHVFKWNKRTKVWEINVPRRTNEKQRKKQSVKSNGLGNGITKANQNGHMH